MKTNDNDSTIVKIYYLLHGLHSFNKVLNFLLSDSFLNPTQKTHTKYIRYHSKLTIHSDPDIKTVLEPCYDYLCFTAIICQPIQEI